MNVCLNMELKLVALQGNWGPRNADEDVPSVILMRKLSWYGTPLPPLKMVQVKLPHKLIILLDASILNITY